MKIVGAENSAY